MPLAFRGLLDADATLIGVVVLAVAGFAIAFVVRRLLPRLRARRGVR
jgi:hypothetical protein